MPFLGFITHLSMPLFSTGSSLREFQVNPTCVDLPRVTSLHLIQNMGSQKLVVFILFQIPLNVHFSTKITYSIQSWKFTMIFWYPWVKPESYTSLRCEGKSSGMLPDLLVCMQVVHFTERSQSQKAYDTKQLFFRFCRWKRQWFIKLHFLKRYIQDRKLGKKPVFLNC